MDGRRRQWITWDVLFNQGNLGGNIRDEFGPIGMLVFNSFLCACKRNGVQGRMTYVTEDDALAQMGLQSLKLTDEDGKPWTLDQFWAFLAKRRQVKRQRRGRVIDVISTTWEKWQKAPGQRSTNNGSSDLSGKASIVNEEMSASRAQGETQTRRSDPKNTNALQTITNDETYPDLDPDVDLDPDHEIETDLDLDTAPSPLASLEDAITLHHEQAEARRISFKGGEDQLKGWIERLANACTGKNPAFIRQQAMLVVALCLREGPELALAAAIHEAETTNSKIKLPKGLLPIFDRHRVQRGLPATNLRLPDIGRKAS